eukprot:6504384-Prymnesium_polylepis.1
MNKTAIRLSVSIVFVQPESCATVRRPLPQVNRYKNSPQLQTAAETGASYRKAEAAGTGASNRQLQKLEPATDSFRKPQTAAESRRQPQKAADSSRKPQTTPQKESRRQPQEPAACGKITVNVTVDVTGVCSP